MCTAATCARLARLYRQDRITMNDLVPARVDPETLDYVDHSQGPAARYLRERGMSHLSKH
jgi:hypothetical protein